MADLTKTITVKVEIPAIRIPNAPSIDAVTVVNATTLDVGYTDSDDVAATYDIEISRYSDFHALAGQVTIPATPLAGGIETFIVADTSILHYARIRATNSSGTSAWS
jgi:hypothetical protein